jgi:uncharacterized protein YigE (DUF2233 family)
MPAARTQILRLGPLARLGAVAWLFALAACASPLAEASAAAAREAQPCAAQSFEHQGFLICPFDPAREEARILSTAPDGTRLRSFDALAAALGADASRVRYAMNAGMFDESGAPVGLYVASGEERQKIVTNNGAGNFYMKPNGVFTIDAAGAPHVATTEAYVAQGAQPLWATQSGPMLVIDGALNAHFQADGQSRHIRNGVGMCGDRAFFAISRSAVSFGKFARLFRDALKCDNALYLDGTISSAWVPALHRKDDAHPLGPMIVVLGKAPAPTQ